MATATKPKIETAEGLEPEDENEVGPALRSGWDGADQVSKRGAKYAENFSWPLDNNLVYFMDDGPFAAYLQHWIGERQGKKSFVCIEDDCPLCKIGDKPRKQFAYNVALINDGSPMVYMLTAGPRLQQKLVSANKSRRGPLVSKFWDLTKTGKLQHTDYGVDRVKHEDLVDDWDLDPVEVTAALAELQGYNRSVIYRSSSEELQTIADEISSED